jgi:hypothetical protein
MELEELVKEKKREKLNPNKKIKIKDKRKKTLKKNTIKKNDKSNRKSKNSASAVSEGINVCSYSNFNAKSDINNITINIQKNKNSKKNKKNSIKHNCMDYNEYELYLLPYKYALKFDKRSFLEKYITLIKIQQLILFSFYPKKDHNLLLIKIDIFFLLFSIHHFINALFFNEETIHTIYEGKGVYNLGYLISQIIYSLIIADILCAIIKYLSLSDRNIFELKFEESKIKKLKKLDKVRGILITKYICFYTLGVMFYIFLWYYLSSFSAVYKNTQIFLIINTFISFAISLLYPFIFCFLPVILRNYSLNNRKEFIFIISTIMQYI